jgi:hypothetical protein
MERRFRVRLDGSLDDAVVEPAVLSEMLPRLKRFLEPSSGCGTSPRVS